MQRSDQGLSVHTPGFMELNGKLTKVNSKFNMSHQLFELPVGWMDKSVNLLLDCLLTALVSVNLQLIGIRLS